MLMENLIEYSDHYLNTSVSLWQYYKDEPNDNIANSESFRSKIKIKGNTPDAGNQENLEIAVPLKYLSNFWRTLEMHLINCEINLILTWSENCVISSATGATKFKITYTKLYARVITLSSQDNEKLREQIKSGFKRTINWNERQSKLSAESQNQYFDFLIDRSFQGVYRLFVLSFENENNRKVHKEHYLSKVEIKDFNVMIDVKKLKLTLN